MHTFSTTEARARFADLMKQIENDPVYITQRNIPKAVLLSVDEYEGLIETLEIMADPRLMESIRRGKADIAAGRTVDWDDLKRELKLG